MGNTDEAQKAVGAMRDFSKRRFISEYDFAAACSGWNKEETRCHPEPPEAAKDLLISRGGRDSSAFGRNDRRGCADTAARTAIENRLDSHIERSRT
jgi:hypothetical protein